MYQVPPKKRENLCKMWPKRIHDRMRAELALQDTAEWVEENGLNYPDSVHPIRNFA